MSIAENSFDILHENLSALDATYSAKDVILCPICLRPISKNEVLESGVEHIIPQNIVKQDSKMFKDAATLNQRCGITILCRQPRVCKGTGRTVSDGCNGIKGRLYDRLFRGLLDDAPHTKLELKHSHGVAILIMAYLAAFQYFGYDYILRSDLDEIREQFDYPNDRKTDWLDHACYNLNGSAIQVYATSLGFPFVVGGTLKSDAPLHVIYRRCSAFLPGGHWQSRCVKNNILLLPSDE